MMFCILSGSEYCFVTGCTPSARSFTLLMGGIANLLIWGTQKGKSGCTDWVTLLNLC